VRTPSLIWLAVTPWSVLPVALPPWQTPWTLPKFPASAATADDDDDADAEADTDVDVLLDPARLQPAAIRAAAAMAATALIETLTGFLLADGPR